MTKKPSDEGSSGADRGPDGTHSDDHQGGAQIFEVPKKALEADPPKKPDSPAEQPDSPPEQEE